MKFKPIFIIVLSVLIVSLACNIATGSVPSTETTAIGQPIVPKGKGPAGLTAEATSADSVRLTWQAVEGATSYHISVGINGGEAFPLIDLAPSETSYEDFMAMPGSQLTYVVEALSDSNSIGQSVVNVSTPERQPNPLTVDAQPDSSMTASATINPEGGSVSLKDAKGVEYKLDIPAGALDSPTDISLTAVKNIGGWPLDGDMLGAVKIDPEGLELNSMATLSVTLSGNQPTNNFVNLGFAFSGNGTEFHLKPVYYQTTGTSLVPLISGSGHLSSPVSQDAASIVLETLVMYGVGVGQGTPDNASQLVQYHAPSDNNAALDQKQAAAQAVPEANQSKYLGDLEDVLAYNYGYVVFTSMELAGNCSQLKKAVANMDSYLVRSNNAITRGAQRPDLIKEGQRILWDKLTAKIKSVMDHASDECKKNPDEIKKARAEAGCLDTLLSRIANPPSPFYQDLQNKLTSKFGDNSVADWSGNLDKCLPSYQASGGMGGYNFSGIICSLKEPFQLKAEGMEHFTIDFTPTDGLSGTMNAVGTATDGGITCTDGGPGTYKVSLLPVGSEKIRVTIPLSTLNCPGGSKSNRVIQVFNITPLVEKPAECNK